MKNTNSQPVTATELRREAEQRLKGQQPAGAAPLTEAETARLLHELQVHQIELELQNEDLRRTQEELEVSRARYFDLYDLAPVGYCTVSETWLILEANLTLATRLGVKRGALVTQLFSRFIFKEDQDIFYPFRKKLSATRQPQTCELRMVPLTGPPFWAQLAATVVPATDGPPVLRVVLSDITERKQAEAELQQRHEELVRFADAMVGREMRVIELKEEINALCRKQGEPPRYGPDAADAAPTPPSTLS